MANLFPILYLCIAKSNTINNFINKTLSVLTSMHLGISRKVIHVEMTFCRTRLARCMSNFQTKKNPYKRWIVEISWKAVQHSLIYLFTTICKTLQWIRSGFNVQNGRISNRSVNCFLVVKLFAPKSLKSLQSRLL